MTDFDNILHAARERRIQYGRRVQRDFYEVYSIEPINLIHAFNSERHNTVQYRVDQLHQHTLVDLTNAHECSICYEELTPTTMVQLPCKHYYCNGCITTCLLKKYNMCSLCRAPIMSECRMS